jgi:diguanylate cyclase (GGDEF)-like protein
MMRYALQQHILVEREFYDIVSAEKVGRNDEDAVYTDSLTGLGTRAAFERDSVQFTKVFAEGRLTDLTIAIIDLEGGLDLLRQAGKEAHDNMLKTVAQSMRKTFRSSDMAYRFGEDQFALLAPGSSMSNADRMHTLLRAIVQQVHDQGFPQIDAKMGLSTLHEAQKITQETEAAPPAAQSA